MLQGQVSTKGTGALHADAALVVLSSCCCSHNMAGLLTNKTSAGQGYVWMGHRDPASLLWSLAARSKHLWQSLVSSDPAWRRAIEWQVGLHGSMDSLPSVSRLDLVPDTTLAPESSSLPPWWVRPNRRAAASRQVAYQAVLYRQESAGPAWLVYHPEAIQLLIGSADQVLQVRHKNQAPKKIGPKLFPNILGFVKI